MQPPKGTAMTLGTARIPITKTVFGPEELRAIQRPLESGWVVQGPYVREFEEKFSAHTSARHSVATSNCTTALHIAVAALGLKAGDEVIVPAFTWVSTANVVEYMGARPVFCDIDLATYNIDATKIESLVTSRTVGVIPVHLFGLAADMTPILELARRRKLWVVEDAACALGAWYHGSHAGTLGDVGCFSFHPRKSITTGEGGMLTTARDEVAERARSLRDHGASRSDHERHHAATAFLLADYDMLGFNYRMTDIQGALGSVQMDRVAGILDRRRDIARRYDEMLASLPWLRRPAVPPQSVHGYQAYVTLFQPEQPTIGNADVLHERRNRLMAALEERGVATRQGTHAPVNTGFYARKYGLRPEDYPQATLAEKLTLALPLYPQLTDADQAFVVAQLAEQLPSR
jgi:dTDP-4-amino-4,6-dideoxygalactose transaminase